jgi:mycothiol synthase
MWRPWRDWRDLAPMQELLALALRDRAPAAFIHPGDLAWWLGWPPKTHGEIAASTELFETGGRVRAWTMIDDTDVGECVAADGPDALAAEIDRRLASRPGLTRYARDNDDRAIARLMRAGYEPVDGGSYVAFRIDLGDAPVRADPRVRPVELTDDIPARAAITRLAFRVGKPADRYVADYARFMDSPAYPAGWDLVAWAPSGDAAACAIAWPDPVSGVGNFEPVATHPAYRRRGFATAVLRDGCRRLRDAGLTAAIVRTPQHNDAAIALYRSAGFADAYVELAFRRP